MKFEMLMPKMGESITEGTILKWFVSVGDTVTKDEIILEISTDKVDSEIPAPVSGVISTFIAQEGDTVDVGSVIAEIATESNEIAENDQVKDKPVIQSNTEIKPSIVTKKTDKNIKKNRFYSPVVLNIASEHSIDMAQLEIIPGTGLNSRLTKKDLMNFIDNYKSSPSSTSIKDVILPSSAELAKKTEILPMDNMRKSIAEHMIQSKKTSAHVSLYNEVDMSNIFAIRERNKESFKKREDISLTYMPFIVESVVKALKEFPLLNASMEKDKILVKKYYNIGIAVAVENGLIVPNIFNCDEMNLIGLARSVHDVAVRARNKKLKPDELSNGTFSISNFGVYDLTMGFPIINQPQVAILGVGALKKRATVINDAIAIRPMMYLSLTIDHRLIDGAMGAKFLQRIKQLLESYDSELII
jgi:2-oxoglutarate dehydrogenase complex dihydrolipoamide succinyltransferase (E2) component